MAHAGPGMSTCVPCTNQLILVILYCASQTSVSSQADLQKKKRRAPAPPPQPPPPSPVVPSRKEDKEENRKSTVGELSVPCYVHVSGMPALTQVFSTVVNPGSELLVNYINPENMYAKERKSGND